jgi:hypothetical protein
MKSIIDAALIGTAALAMAGLFKDRLLQNTPMSVLGVDMRPYAGSVVGALLAMYAVGKM